jgi:hypothetical protein
VWGDEGGGAGGGGGGGRGLCGRGLLKTALPPPTSRLRRNNHRSSTADQAALCTQGYPSHPCSAQNILIGNFTHRCTHLLGTLGAGHYVHKLAAIRSVQGLLGARHEHLGHHLVAVAPLQVGALLERLRRPGSTDTH